MCSWSPLLLLMDRVRFRQQFLIPPVRGFAEWLPQAELSSLSATQSTKDLYQPQ